LWDDYNLGKIDKQGLRRERFPRIFTHAGGNAAAIPTPFEEDFMHRTSSKPHLFPYSKEILDYLKKSTGYTSSPMDSMNPKQKK